MFDTPRGAVALFVQSLATKVNLTLHTRAGFSVQQADVVSRVFGEAVSAEAPPGMHDKLVMHTYKCVYEIVGEVVVVGVCSAGAAVHPTYRLVRQCVGVVRLIASGDARKERNRAKDVTAAKLQKQAGELYFSLEEALHQTGGVAFAEEAVDAIATRSLLDQTSGKDGRPQPYAAPPSRREASRAPERVDEEIATRMKLQQIERVRYDHVDPSTKLRPQLADDLAHCDALDVDVTAMLPPAAPVIVESVKGNYGAGDSSLPSGAAGAASTKPVANPSRRHLSSANPSPACFAVQAETPPTSDNPSPAASPTGGAFDFLSSPVAARRAPAAQPAPPTERREASLALDDLFAPVAASTAPAPAPRVSALPQPEPKAPGSARANALVMELFPATPAETAAGLVPQQAPLALATTSTASTTSMPSIAATMAAAAVPETSHSLSALVSESVSAVFNEAGDGGEWSLLGELLLLGKGALLPAGAPKQGDPPCTTQALYVRVKGAASVDDIRPNPAFAALVDASRFLYRLTVRMTVEPSRAAPIAVLKYRQQTSKAYPSVYPIKAKATWLQMPRHDDTPPTLIDQVTLQWAANPYVKLTSVAFEVNARSDAFAPDKQQSKPRADFDAGSSTLRWGCMVGGQAVEGSASTLQARLHCVLRGAADGCFHTHAASRRPVAVQFEGTGLVGAMKVVFFADEACSTPAVLTGGVSHKFKSGKYLLRSAA